MFKRIALALAFVTAFGAASLATPQTAEARRGWYRWGRPHVSYYYAPPRYRYYTYRRPYRTYYRSYYRPRYYDPYYYGGYYDDYPAYYYPRSGVTFSIGF